jgi:hypothetical protein
MEAVGFYFYVKAMGAVVAFGLWFLWAVHNGIIEGRYETKKKAKGREEPRIVPHFFGRPTIPARREWRKTHAIRQLRSTGRKS